MPELYRHTGNIARFFAIAGALVFFAGHGRAVSAASPAPYKGFNLIVISITNIGTEHMSLYGYGRDTTPELAKWAEGSLVFENAYGLASWTLPAATSMFTGLYPYTHKVLARERNQLLSKKARTLAEALKKAGYSTAAFTGGLDYMKAAGHMRGFETIPDNPPFTKFEVTIPQAKSWLKDRPGKPFFLFLHGYDAHPPFIPSGRFKGRYSEPLSPDVKVDPAYTYRGYRSTGSGGMTAYYHEARALTGLSASGEKPGQPKQTVLRQADLDYLTAVYDEKVREVDLLVGEFLGSLSAEIRKKTIIAIVSEHGDLFGRHGRFGRGGAHSGGLYDEVLHVPLLIRLPGGRAGRLRGLAQLVDYTPTFLDLLGIKPPDPVQGVSLSGLMNGGPSPDKFAYAGAGSDAPPGAGGSAFKNLVFTEAIRDERWKLIRELVSTGSGFKGQGAGVDKTELYDLSSDPYETKDLAATRPEIVQSLTDKLKQWAVAARAFSLNAPSAQKLSPAVLEKAKERGYW